jgi:hypothetical protein
MAAWAGAAAPAARVKAAAAARLENAREAWDTAITVIDEARKKQAQAPGLQEPAKKALATLDREWDGLIAHRDYPMVSLDNNSAERQIRGPVVTRKNAGGSRNGGTAACHLVRYSGKFRPHESQQPHLAHRAKQITLSPEESHAAFPGTLSDQS